MGNTVQAYIDARDVAARLNEVVGAENWSDSYEMFELEETQEFPIYKMDDNGNLVTQKNKWGKDEPVKIGSKRENVKLIGAMCKLTILGITKSDVGNPALAEHVKSCVSDAKKRAAVKFGIGAYLYELKGLDKTTKFKDLPDFAKPKLKSAHDYIFELVRENCLNTQLLEIFLTNYRPYLPVIVLRDLFVKMKELV